MISRLLRARERPATGRGRRAQAVAMWPARRRRWPLVVGAALGCLLVLLTAPVAALLWLVQPPVPPDSYVEAVVGEPPLLNPVLAPYSQAGQDVLPLVFASLTSADAVGNVGLELAARLDADDDGHVFTVRLRDGLRWDDGEPLTAEDVAFTVRLVQAPDHQGSQELADLWRGVEVEVVDPLTVRFLLPTPLAAFPRYLGLGLLPRHALDGVSAAALPFHPFNRAPVGSGPYRVASYTPDRLVLERSSTFAGPPPRLGRLELRLYDDRAAALRAAQNGDVDGLAGLRPDEIAPLVASPRLTVYALPERSKTAGLVFNLDAPLLGELAVRRAIAEAVDRAALIEGPLGGQGEPALGPIPVQSWAYARPPQLALFDPAAAAARLDAAGWTPGAGGVRQRDGTPLRLELATADTAERLAVAQALVDQLGRVGIGLEVRAVPTDVLFDDVLDPRAFQVALVGRWTIGSDPDVYPQWHASQIGRSGGNAAGFRDPDADRWLEVGRQEPDRDIRRDALLHFQARWAEEQPGVMLYHPRFSFAVARDVWGVAADPLPDSSWRLRGAVSWHRVARPTGWHEARALVVARASRWFGWSERPTAGAAPG